MSDFNEIPRYVAHLLDTDERAFAMAALASADSEISDPGDLVLLADRLAFADERDSAARLLERLIDGADADPSHLVEAHSIAVRLGEFQIADRLLLAFEKSATNDRSAWQVAVKSTIGRSFEHARQTLFIAFASLTEAKDRVALLDWACREGVAADRELIGASLGDAKFESLDLTDRLIILELLDGPDGPLGRPIADEIVAIIDKIDASARARSLALLARHDAAEAGRRAPLLIDECLPFLDDVGAARTLNCLAAHINDSAFDSLLALLTRPERSLSAAVIIETINTRASAFKSLDAAAWYRIVAWLAQPSAGALGEIYRRGFGRWGAPPDAVILAVANRPLPTSGEPRRCILLALLHAARADSSKVRKSLYGIKPKDAGADSDFVRALQLTAFPVPLTYYGKAPGLRELFERGVTPDDLPQLLPPGGARVLVLCERDASPAVFVPIAKENNYRVTYCSMDSFEIDLPDDAVEVWSLRDLLPDHDPRTTDLYLDVQRQSERIVSTWLELYKRAKLQMAEETLARILSIALEDALMGPVIMGGCFLRALEQFNGDAVIFVQKGGTTFAQFASSFITHFRRPIYFCHSDLNGRSLQKIISQSLAKVSDAPSNQVSKLDAAIATRSVFARINGIEKRQFTKLIGESDLPAVAFMGFFGDPIYIGNIVPLLRELVKKHHVYIIEATSISACKAALKDAFGESDDARRLRISVIDLQIELDTILRKAKLKDHDFEPNTMLALQRMEQCEFESGGLHIRHLLTTRVPALFRTVLTRLHLAARFFDKILSTGRFSALYVCSERLSINMTAVEIARKHNLPTIDVMAVNSVRLPRYKTPAATFATAIDTLTVEFFRSFYGLPDSRIAITGSPRLDEMLHRYRYADKDEILHRLQLPTSASVALIASQLQPMSRFVSIFEQTLEAARRVDDLHVLVKMHRRENLAREQIYWQVAKRSGMADRIRIVRLDPILKEIESCLKVSNVVISMYSNVLREAACVGIPIVIADYFGTELPFDYLESGIGTVARTPEELTELVVRLVNGGAPPAYVIRNNHFFARNPQLLDGRAAERIAALART